MKLSRKQKALELELGRPIRDVICEMVTEHGQAETAELLGVPKATLNYWILRMGLRVSRVCHDSDEEVIVVPKGTGLEFVFSGAIEREQEAAHERTS